MSLTTLGSAAQAEPPTTRPLRRPLTPLNPASIVRRPKHGTTQIETWGADSADGIWKYVRQETAGTPWAVEHVPTGRIALRGNLQTAQQDTADGSLLAELDAAEAAKAQQESTTPAAPRPRMTFTVGGRGRGW